MGRSTISERLSRKEDTWHIVGINGEAKAKSLDIDISFATNQKGVLFFDGASKIPEIKNIEADKLSIELKPYSGFVIKI